MVDLNGPCPHLGSTEPRFLSWPTPESLPRWARNRTDPAAIERRTNRRRLGYSGPDVALPWNETPALGGHGPFAAEATRGGIAFTNATSGTLRSATSQCTDSHTLYRLCNPRRRSRNKKLQSHALFQCVTLGDSRHSIGAVAGNYRQGRRIIATELTRGNNQQYQGSLDGRTWVQSGEQSQSLAGA
jgi:hypothetical protein